MFGTISLLLAELCLKNYFVLMGDTCRFRHLNMQLNMLFVWLTISNCLKMWRYNGYEECKNVYRKQIKKTSIFICLIFLCHKLIIKMHCIGNCLMAWITLCLQIKISRRICNRLEPLRYQNLNLFKHFWNLKYFDNRTKRYCVPFRQTGCVFIWDTRYKRRKFEVHCFSVINIILGKCWLEC